MNFITLILVGCAGIIGAVSRYLLSNWLKMRISKFPIGTFAVNAIGCFLMGYFCAYLSIGSMARLVVCSGFIGSFTTFSTFIADVHELQNTKISILKWIYILSSVLVCLGMVWCGENMFYWVIN